MIPIFKPNYTKEEFEALREVFKRGWTGLGPKTKEFEEKFANYIKTRYAVGLNSCTAALHLALKVMDVKNREVITTPLTFVSTNHAILYNQGIPVFADVYPDTLNISVEQIEERITSKTKAIVVVHYGGHPCDMDPIFNMARKYGIKIIEDAAHGCGGEYKGRKIGSLGDIACFSFQAVKNLSTGDGGMITTNDTDIYERLKCLRWLGINKTTWERKKDNRYSWQYDVGEVGFKYHMNDIQAAIGLVQLKKLDKSNHRRREIFLRYNSAFKNIPWIETPVIKSYANSACHNYVIKVKERDKLSLYLQKKGISTGVHYIPNNLYRIYRHFKGNTPVSKRIWKTLLTLPLYPDLKDKEVDKIIKAVKAFRPRGQPR